MPDPKDPQGSTPEPTPQPPRAEQSTTPLPVTGTPTPTAEQPAAGAPQPAVEQPTPQPTAEQPASEPVTTASASEALPGPAGPVYATAPRRRFRQVAAHRATQLVAVGVLGLIIGGGLVTLLDRDGYRGGGHGRAGISRMDDRGAPHSRGDHGPRREDRGRFER